MPTALAVRRGFAGVTIAIAFAGVYLTLASPSTNATEHVTGTWTANYSLVCSASLSQEADLITGSVECGSRVMLEVEGTFDPGARTFSLVGEFIGVMVQIEGVMSGDGISVTGTVFASPLVIDGEFFGIRDRDPDSNNVAGLWLLSVRVFAGHCLIDLGQQGDDVEGEIRCTDGPSGAFNGVFGSDEGELTLNGSIGDFEPVEFRFRISDDGSTFHGTWRLLPDGPGGIMDGERVMALLGDANCDGLVEAADAALVLQSSAGLLGSVACQDAADVNSDGTVGSLDAVLILQFTTGLLDSL